MNDIKFEWDNNKAQAKMLIVCHCYRSADEIIRIISARKATKTEAQQYNEINKGW